ncbi:MAG: amidase [Sphingopyxis sp.]|nr:amidase [Sphingopyxis sp.]
MNVFDSASSLGAQIAAGTTTSVAICQDYLTRITAKNPAVNAVVAQRANAAIMADAAAADVRAAAGARLSPLDGVPFTLKAVIETEGLRTTTGHPLVDYVPLPGKNSDIANLLKAAGAVLIGKTNAPGDVVFTEPATTGRCKNPFNVARATGGSSGGSAAAVAAGLTGFDVGTDAAGSIRMPASWCGVYGLKPTYGAISSIGDIWPVTRDRPPVYRDLCVPGPLARSLDDLSLVLQLLNRPTRDGSDVHPLWSISPRPLQKVVVIDKIGLWNCDAVVQGALEALLVRLAAAGVTVVRKPAFPVTEARVMAVYDALWGAPSAVINNNYPYAPNVHASDWANNNVWVDASYSYGLHASSLIEVWKLRRQYMTWLEDADVVLTPTHAVEAPLFGTPIPNSITYMCMVVLYNLIGVPAVSIPLGAHANGSRFGLQVVGRHHDDLTLLNFAKQVDAHSCGFVQPTL